MKYIDKKPFLKDAHQVTDNYLNSVCKIDEGNGTYLYLNVDYDGTFNSSGAKGQIIQLALRSQECLCCYCMRDLSMENQQITLEHIIPQSCSKREFGDYINLGVEYLSDEDVIRTKEFINVTNIKIPPRPHTVTFENLTASCDGTFPDKKGCSMCCNHKRGNAFVYPMFYISMVENEMDYMDDGTIQPKVQSPHQDEFRDTINKTRLNCTSLKDIRRLWHLLRGIDFQVLQDCITDTDLREKTLLHVLFKEEEQGEQDANILEKYKKDDYWQTLMLYHWFHNRI